MLAKFDEHFAPRQSEVFERFKFMKRSQAPGESFDTWLVDMKALADSCNYGDGLNSIIRDFIVLGVEDDNTREKLLYETGLTLAKAIEICRACESAKSHLSKIASQPSPANVHAVGYRKPSNSQQNHPSTSGNQSSSGGYKGNHPQCNKCGRHHKSGECRAGNIKCYKCDGMGHYAKFCTGKDKSLQIKSVAAVQSVEETVQLVEETAFNPAFGSDFMVIHTLHALKKEKKQWFQNLSLDGNIVNFKLDTGATCNIITLQQFDSLPLSKSIHSRSLKPGPKVVAYGTNTPALNVRGTYNGEVLHKGKVFRLDFVVVDEPGQPPLLGLPACEELNLINRVDAIASVPPRQDQDVHPIIREFQDVFTGLGKLPIEYDIRLATGTNYIDPVVCPAARLPLSMEEKTHKALIDMVDNEVLAPVTEPTEYVSRMMTTLKPNGDVRVCIDPSELNKAILRPHFSVPTAEELFAKIGKARYFCNLDAASGFYQIPLSERSSYLCTMATPWGRFRYLRLPFGLASAPEVYLQAMQEFFGDLPGVFTYFDDFLVKGETMAELLHNLRLVLERCRLVNLKMQYSKCRFFLEEIPWIGHVIGHGTLKPDPEKVEAIVNMPGPTDKNGLVRLLGMVTYLSKFCQNLANDTRPLRDLLKADVAWVWESQQQVVFDQLKKKISSLPVLRLFDPAKHVVVSVDASPIGVGAALLQEGQPVSFASKTLTDTQQRYCQIEKETLAIMFGLGAFRQYVIGNSVTVESDHKPLVGLFQKPIAKCTPRIQRMRLQLSRYDFKIVYKPGRELFIADTLSRAPSPSLYESDSTQHSEEQVCMVLDQVMPSTDTRSKYAVATEEDDTLRLVKKILVAGWPERRSHCPAQAKPFWSVRDDLAEANGLLLYGERVVVPMSLRREVMEAVHEGHFGELKCVQRARSAVYWPGCDDQIRNMVASCSTCQLHRHKNPAPSLHPVKLPSHPFQMLSADHFQFEGANFLLAVDAYSKWPCAAQLNSISASHTIVEMERIFADFGTPEELQSDNHVFGSHEFRTFCQSRGVKQTTSSPEFARSNGLVERHVQTVKERLLKMLGERKTLWDALAAIRSTPVSDSLPSPAVLLQGRNLRGRLPFLPAALKPQLVPAEFVHRELQKRQSKAAFDKGGAQGARESVLVVGQKVRAFIANCWQPGKVESVCPEPNSYTVRLDDGRLFRRTRNAINANQSVTAGVVTVIARPVAPVGPAAATRPASAPPQPDTPAQQSQRLDNMNTSLLQPSVVLANLPSAATTPSPAVQSSPAAKPVTIARRLDPCLKEPRPVPLPAHPPGSTRSGLAYEKK